jgi:hypothetical protein
MKRFTILPLLLLAAGCARPLPLAPVAPAVPLVSSVQTQSRSRSTDGVVESMRIMAKRQMVQQDKNKDGKLTRQEWEGWDRDFDLADISPRDNRITLAEYEALMTSQLSIDTFRGIAYRELRELDKNADERIVDAEWKASYRTWHDGTDFKAQAWQPFDRNKDAKLDAIEFEDAFVYYWARHD